MRERESGWGSLRGWILPMRPRSPDEAHRAATPLELFFDLVFVVAIAQAAVGLHHGIAEAHVFESIVSYLMVFFAIWLAWLNYTWFSSAYDVNDVPYRLIIFLQLTGALILAGGIYQAFEYGDFRIVATGYVVMRIAAVTLWLRVARHDIERRSTALKYAIGIALIQIGWVTLIFGFGDASWFMIGFGVLVLFELLNPYFAERTTPTPWHPHHIKERYGLFTIIVLGESILAASLGIQSAITESGGLNLDIALLIAGGLLIIFSLWWIYFDWPVDNPFDTLGHTFLWGYGHYFIFAAAAAVGAGLSVAIDYAQHHAEISAAGAGFAIAIPVATYLGLLWLLHLHSYPGTTFQKSLTPITVALILMAPFVGGPSALYIGLLLVALITSKLIIRARG